LQWFFDDGTDWDFRVTAFFGVDFGQVTRIFGVFDFPRAFVDSEFEDLVCSG
jgi:hypothetical protein